MEKNSEDRKETERLRERVGELTAQVNILSGKLHESVERMKGMEIGMTLRRIEFLYKVLEHGEWFGQEYCAGCVEEIKGLMEIGGEGDGEA